MEYVELVWEVMKEEIEELGEFEEVEVLEELDARGEMIKRFEIIILATRYEF